MSRPGPTLSTAMLDAAVELMGRAGRRGTVAVQGESMLPTFRGVERVAVEFAVDRPRFGDVLVFRQRGILVVHRLVGTGPRGLRTRGDGTIGFDPWVDPASIVGRVIALGTEDGRWLDVRAGAARLWARTLALHDLCWGGCGALLVRFGGRRGDDWRWRLGRVDRALLGAAHACGFRWFHRARPAAEFGAEAVAILPDSPPHRARDDDDL